MWSGQTVTIIMAPGTHGDGPWSCAAQFRGRFRPQLSGNAVPTLLFRRTPRPGPSCSSRQFISRKTADRKGAPKNETLSRNPEVGRGRATQERGPGIQRLLATCRAGPGPSLFPPHAS